MAREMLTTMTEEEMINAAIQASLEELHGSTMSCVKSFLPNSMSRNRNKFEARRDKHFSGIMGEGLVIQINTMDQYSNFTRGLVSEFGTADAICGYFSLANMLIIKTWLSINEFRGNYLTLEQLKKIVSTLKDKSNVSHSIRQVMHSIQSSRELYVNNNKGNFRTKGVIQNYLKDWVANFEVSDYLQKVVTTDENVLSCDDKVVAIPASFSSYNNLYFMRFNQYPQLHNSKHEERERLIRDEKCFGGKMLQRDQVYYGDNDSVFIIERFGGDGKRKLLRPEEWDSNAVNSIQLFVADLNGHFVTCLSCCMQIDEDGVGFEADSLHSNRKNVLLVFNSTRNCYLDSPIIPFMFDKIFGELRGNFDKADDSTYDVLRESDTIVDVTLPTKVNALENDVDVIDLT